jgi:hypothetical protein
MGMNDATGVTVRKVLDREVRLNVIFDLFPLVEKNGKCMPTWETLSNH